MQIRYALYFFQCIYSEVCTIEQYRGNEHKVQELNISGQKWTSICTDRLKLFTHLKKLNISCTNLSSIPDGIEHLHNLVELDFSYNLGIGNNEVLKRLGLLPKLNVLNFCGNRLTEVPVCLYLSDNSEINRLNKAKTPFVSLKELNLSDNNIEHIPSTLLSLVKLENLNISKNNLVHVPVEIAILSNLKVLSIRENNILYIPNEICSLLCLEDFDVSHNAIQNIPASLFTLTALRKLNLSRNAIKTLSPLLGQLTNLTKLNISHNHIDNVPDEIQLLHNLMRLNASHNKFTALSSTVIFPKNIITLDLSRNSLVVLPNLSYLESLKFLNISFNNFRILPYEIGLIKKLDTLNASFNYLEELPETFGNLQCLTYLALENNLLSALPFSFSKLYKISYLNLGSNMFSIFPVQILSLRELNTLLFTKNFLESLVTTSYLRTQLLDDSIDKTSDITLLDQDNIAQVIWKRSICSLDQLLFANFDNNKITEIPNDINLCEKLMTLSLANNKIKEIPEEIGKLISLKVLNLQSNHIKCLPFSLRVLRTHNLFMLRIYDNFVPQNDSDFGLGIESIKNLKFTILECQNQYTYLTITEVLRNIQKENLHWNINELKEIKLPADLSMFATKISDKQMRKIWRVVLKYFIISEHLLEDPDTDSSDEINYEIDETISKITTSSVFIDIKNKVYSGGNHILDTNIDLQLQKKVSIFLRNNSTDAIEDTNDTNKMQNLLKNTIKALFSKILEKIVEEKFNIESLELIKLALTDLVENKLFVCIDGQLEGLQYYYSIFFAVGNEITDNVITNYIRNLLASTKETTFIKITNLDDPNGVHYISKWRVVFKDILGITQSFDDPYASRFPFINNKYKSGSILHRFFNDFTVDNVSKDILDKINSNSIMINESVDLLKHICKVELPLENDYNIYMNVIKEYFEYEQLSGFSELQAKKLKKRGLLKILLHLRILNKQLTAPKCKKLKSF